MILHIGRILFSFKLSIALKRFRVYTRIFCDFHNTMARRSGVREDRHFFTRNGMRLLHHETTWKVVHVIKCIHLELLKKKNQMSTIFVHISFIVYIKDPRHPVTCDVYREKVLLTSGFTKFM